MCRLAFLVTVLFACTAGPAQEAGFGAKALVEASLTAWTREPALCFQASGTATVGDKKTSFTTTVWRSGTDRVRLQYTENGDPSSLVLVLADGKSVWRWNQRRHEFQQVAAPGTGAQLLQLLLGLTPANATGALRLAFGNADLVPAGEFAHISSTSGPVTKHLVRCSLVKGSGKTEVGTKATFEIAEDETGPWLVRLHMTQNYVVSRSLARVEWIGSFVRNNELEAKGYRFVPPAGSRCVGVYGPK